VTVIIDLLDIALAGGIHWTELVRRQIAAARMAEDPGATARGAAGRVKQTSKPIGPIRTCSGGQCSSSPRGAFLQWGIILILLT
jgi:hypothetical protein